MKTIILIATGLLFLASCQSGSQKGSDDAQEQAVIDSLYERGDMITQVVFDSLRTHLMAAALEGGMPGAVAYCNAQAMPITSELEELYQVSIRRATDKARNPANAATGLELEYLKVFRDSLAKDAPPRPILIRDAADGHYHYFKPIFTMGLCLNCHGTEGGTLNPEAIAKVRESYPSDQATGYSDKELRGTWHIEFRQ